MEDYFLLGKKKPWSCSIYKVMRRAHDISAAHGDRLPQHIARCAHSEEKNLLPSPLSSHILSAPAWLS